MIKLKAVLPVLCHRTFDPTAPESNLYYKQKKKGHIKAKPYKRWVIVLRSPSIGMPSQCISLMEAVTWGKIKEVVVQAQHVTTARQKPDHSWIPWFEGWRRKLLALRWEGYFEPSRTPRWLPIWRGDFWDCKQTDSLSGGRESGKQTHITLDSVYLGYVVTHFCVFI